MTHKKIRAAILFGGKSAEHEISLLSAKNIIYAIDRKKYDIELIGIDKKGQWHQYDLNDFLINADDAKSIALKESKNPVTLVLGKKEQLYNLMYGELGYKKTLKLDTILSQLCINAYRGRHGKVKKILNDEKGQDWY